jgi:hypothetical protein
VNKGILHHNQLCHVWKDCSLALHPFLLGLLESFDLIIQLPNSEASTFFRAISFFSGTPVLSGSSVETSSQSIVGTDSAGSDGLTRKIESGEGEERRKHEVPQLNFDEGPLRKEEDEGTERKRRTKSREEKEPEEDGEDPKAHKRTKSARSEKEEERERRRMARDKDDLGLDALKDEHRVPRRRSADTKYIKKPEFSERDSEIRGFTPASRHDAKDPEVKSPRRRLKMELELDHSGSREDPLTEKEGRAGKEGRAASQGTPKEATEEILAPRKKAHHSDDSLPPKDRSFKASRRAECFISGKALGLDGSLYASTQSLRRPTRDDSKKEIRPVGNLHSDSEPTLPVTFLDIAGEKDKEGRKGSKSPRGGETKESSEPVFRKRVSNSKERRRKSQIGRARTSDSESPSKMKKLRRQSLPKLQSTMGRVEGKSPSSVGISVSTSILLRPRGSLLGDQENSDSLSADESGFVASTGTSAGTSAGTSPRPSRAHPAISLVPALLPTKISPEMYSWLRNLWPEFPQDVSPSTLQLHRSYSFAFIPKGLFSRLIVRIMKLFNLEGLWGQGLLVSSRDGTQKILIEHFLDEFISSQRNSGKYFAILTPFFLPKTFERVFTELLLLLLFFRNL